MQPSRPRWRDRGEHVGAHRPKALEAGFVLAETYPKASVGFAAAAVPANADTAPIIAEMKGILSGYAEKGVPPALVEAARKGEIASAEFDRTRFRPRNPAGGTQPRR